MCCFVDHVKSTLSQEGGNKFTSSALSSFLSSVKPGEDRNLTEDDLRLWMVSMILSGFKKTTRKRYFGKVNNLYLDWVSTSASNPFRLAEDAVNTDFDIYRSEKMEANLELVKYLLMKSNGSFGREYINAFLYLLYDVEATLEDVINLKFDDPTRDLPQIDDIIRDMRQSKQLKYVFGLSRGAKRMPQLKRELLEEMEAVLRMTGMRFEATFSRESITAIWIAAALRCNIPADEIRSLIKLIPQEYTFLSLVKPKELSEERKTNILKTVANSINNKTFQWFVMRMRSGKTPDDIKKCIQESDADNYDSMTFYYPTHVVIREAKNKKKIREDVPYIPGILFFRTRTDRVRSLFNKIGEMAWCYKHTNTIDSPYSTIPKREMERFQRQIGAFTDDIKMELVTDEDSGRFAVDDIVRINGGLLAGSIGTITAIRNQDGTTTYSLRLSGSVSCRWTVAEVDELFIEPLENS